VVDDLAAVFFIRILELKLHLVLLVVLHQCAEKRLRTIIRRSILSHVPDKERDCDHHQFLDLLLGQTCLSGNLADRSL
jgi:hypothetical protein